MNTYVNIREARFRQALFEEFPGIHFKLEDHVDMLSLWFSFQVKSGTDVFVNEADGFEAVAVLAERVRQEALVKTGAARQVRAANDQAEQYRQENVRLARMVQDRDEAIRDLKARITDLQDQIGENI